MRLPLVLLVCFAAACSRHEGPWNVLLLVADDMGTDLVGAYAEGTDLPSTPNLDALAARGVLFRRAWVNPLCSPSRAALQTGRYSFRTGVGFSVGRFGYGLPLEEQTLPEMLAERSPVRYATAAFGKWHLGGESTGGWRAPNVAGYDHFSGTLYNLRGDVGGEPASYFRWPKVVDGFREIETGYVTSDTVDSALRWIEHAPEPWLVWVAFHAPHYPFHAPPAHLHGVALEGAGSPLPVPGGNPRPYVRAMVEALDTEIGRLLGELGRGVRSRTVVIFIGDNGTPERVAAPPFDPLRAKNTLYEGGIRVPLIVSGPLVEAPGRESEALVNGTDLYATIADLAGIEPETLDPPRGPLDSVSLIPHLRDPTAAPRRRTIFAEKFFPNGWPPVVWSYAIRDSRFKLIRLEGRPPPGLRSPFMDRPEEFYDLEQDPRETRDLLLSGELSPEGRRAYEALRAELARLFGDRRLTRPVPGGG